MKNIIKKSASVILAVIMTIPMLAMGSVAYGGTLVAINSANFTDANFRAVVSDWYDEDGDGYLSSDEIGGVTLVSISGMLMDTCGDDAVITSLKGIEFFTACKRLRCGGIGLESLDVSAMPQLIELTCAGNSLTSINLSNNTNLEWLNCSSNELTALDITSNRRLTRLDCYINSLTSLNVRNNTALDTLRCQRNELTVLDLSANTNLTILNCSSNHMLTLDLSNNTKLVEPTDAFLGHQTTSAPARIDLGNFYVSLAVPNYSRITSTSVDREETVNDATFTVLGYDGMDFTPQSYDQIENGIVYYYDTGLENAESMSVYIDVIRDFYQVRFYTDENKNTLIKSELVNVGGYATAPEITELPQCKSFDGWSDTYDNVQGDVEVYALWQNNHTMAVTAFNGNIVRVSCTECGNEQKDYEFDRLINVCDGEKRYVAAVDVVHDGIINVQDYAKLRKMFR